MHHIKTTKIYRQKGIAIVEATIVLPLLILVMLGILDFGRVMHASITTTNAARAAAGYGAQSSNLSIDYNGMTATAKADAKSLATDAHNSEPVAVTSRRVCRCVGESSEVNCANNACTNTVEIYVEVTATRNFRTVVPYPLIPDTIQLSRMATIRVQ